MAAIQRTHPHTIGDVARLIGATLRTLRFYEELHLISPNRNSSERRFYSDADVARLKRITHLAHLGFSLVEVKQLLDSKSEDQVVAALHRRRVEVSADIDHLQQVLRDILEEIAAVSPLPTCVTV